MPGPITLTVVVAQNARGQQVQNELALFVDDGVAGVVAALIADDDIVFFAQSRSTMRPLPSSPQFTPVIAVNIIHSPFLPLRAAAAAWRSVRKNFRTVL